MNLYEKFKAGLLGRKARVHSQARVFSTPLKYGGYSYHIIDPDGRESAMVRTDAVVVYHALGAALKATK